MYTLQQQQPDVTEYPWARLTVTRNSYIAAIAVTIVFAALLATSLPGHDWLSASLHAITDFKVMWLCVLIAAWQILSTPGRPLQRSAVVIGGGLAALSAVTAGLWPWLFLILFSGLFLLGTNRRQIRQALALLLAIGVHETAVALCSEIFADVFLGLDALIAGSLTHWLLPDIQVAGSMLYVPGGHAVMLVWGCSSLSYVGDMILLCWALCLFLAGDDGIAGGLWKWLVTVACVTVMLNAARLALMASDFEMYNFLHAGPGATAFRVIILTGAVGIAWLHSKYALSKLHRAA